MQLDSKVSFSVLLGLAYFQSMSLFVSTLCWLQLVATTDTVTKSLSWGE